MKIKYTIKMIGLIMSCLSPIHLQGKLIVFNIRIKLF